MNKGIKRLWAALGHSCSGIAAAWRDEAAFRLEVALLCALLPVACLVDVPPTARAMLIASLLLVVIAELLNTAIEALTDICAPEIQALAKKAKDTASAAVFVALVVAIVVWGLILTAA